MEAHERSVTGAKETMCALVYDVLVKRIKVNKDGSEEEKGPVAHVANLIAIFEHDPSWAKCLGYDELLAAPVIRSSVHNGWRLLTDGDESNASGWILRVYNMNCPAAMITAAMATVCQTNRFHPVRDYLNGLTWDGVGRIGGWLTTYFGAEESFLTQHMGRLWLIGAAKRALEPGCQMDVMLVLQGEQGARKTDCGRILSRCGVKLPEEAFCSMPADVASKDTQIAISSSWIVEVGELDAIRRGEATAVKNFLTIKTDRYRPPYGRHMVSVPRTCAFFGTTNEDTFLDDSTGSRRFWVVKVVKLDRDALLRDVDQLWAEAAHLAKSGVLPYLNELMEIQRIQAAREFTVVDPWEAKITQWLNNSDVKEFELSMILEFACGLSTSQQTRAQGDRVRKVLRHLGYVRKQRRNNYERVWKYVKEEPVSP